MSVEKQQHQHQHQHTGRPGPDAAHRRPAGTSDTTVEALGALSKALETTERARGHLYSFHQLTGTADLELDRAVALLREAGHREQADRVEREIQGRNVIPGRWTFQIVEEYNRTYYRPFAELEQELIDRLADGRDHLYEAELKEARRTRHHPDHTAKPSEGPASHG
ncbi:hypothetical protein NX801_28395 [Streptomyces sp. LP05-1]|uniref:Uncharacterized protein n=1 Tax=Streptomyces pyxinae TaxID=2970734 RepID=A0ABT2CPX4_9ACTN|nr:hypothetical protein [Streptomyces sp. LP05-1]MCS0639485.1 hypothetical protein [Streptomyces sp. LP05-1]